jgi:hypothetical protein
MNRLAKGACYAANGFRFEVQNAVKVFGKLFKWYPYKNGGQFGGHFPFFMYNNGNWLLWEMIVKV